jgi:hypothetical protein
MRGINEWLRLEPRGGGDYVVAGVTKANSATGACRTCSPKFAPCGGSLLDDLVGSREQ